MNGFHNLEKKLLQFANKGRKGRGEGREALANRKSVYKSCGLPREMGET